MEWNGFVSFYMVELMLLDMFVIFPEKYRSSVTRNFLSSEKKNWI